MDCMPSFFSQFTNVTDPLVRWSVGTEPRIFEFKDISSYCLRYIMRVSNSNEVVQASISGLTTAVDKAVLVAWVMQTFVGLNL